jgi:hypothetical protein
MDAPRSREVSSLEEDFLNDFAGYSEDGKATDLAYAKSHAGFISASKVSILATYQPNIDVIESLKADIYELESKIENSKSGRVKMATASIEIKQRQLNSMLRDDLPEGAVSWARKLACIRMTGFCEESDVSFDNKATRWGKLNEPRAIEKIKERYPDSMFLNTCENQKFIKLDGFDHVGATPDAKVINNYVSNDTVLDVKCPLERDIHLLNYGQITSYAQFKRDYPMYYWQGVLQMMCAKVNKFMFASYDWRFESVGKDLFVYEFDLIHEDADFLRSRIEKTERLISEIMAGVK